MSSENASSPSATTPADSSRRPSRRVWFDLGATEPAPIMQYHSEFNHHRILSRDRTPWNIAERTGDERVLPLFREFVQLRERLLPYLTEEAAKTIAADRPLMRPLFFDHPGDRAAACRVPVRRGVTSSPFT